MKVKIISGNDAGVVKDLPQVEAEIAIQTGFAEKVDDLQISAEDIAAVFEVPADVIGTQETSTSEPTPEAPKAE